ncbi:unnamed protein product [Parascedosporium putredinis]|uniref:Integral membrane protein n=1 Tax=Parascedosporium putredinis TaxID=1442378 RepID=A0A9P1H171_9PEZI|nr:unnamed protein product [Parascedosporium putredinis]CAI7992456.1 unnamed protein product [Parascedosporium putredinis]
MIFNNRHRFRRGHSRAQGKLPRRGRNPAYTAAAIPLPSGRLPLIQRPLIKLPQRQSTGHLQMPHGSAGGSSQQGIGGLFPGGKIPPPPPGPPPDRPSQGQGQTEHFGAETDLPGRNNDLRYPHGNVPHNAQVPSQDRVQDLAPLSFQQPALPSRDDATTSSLESRLGGLNLNSGVQPAFQELSHTIPQAAHPSHPLPAHLTLVQQHPPESPSFHRDNGIPASPYTDTIPNAGHPARMAHGLQQTYSAPPLPAKKAPPPSDMVSECIDSPVTFPTKWYSPAGAPEFYICSKCQYDHICGTPWRLRYKDNGAKGTDGVRWFKAIEGSIPNMVICEACYEDYVFETNFRHKFEVEGNQRPDELWACDLAIDYLKKELQKRTESADWQGFVTEANARLNIPACPRWDGVGAGTRRWFTPTFGSYERDGVLICAACYCDYVLNTDQTPHWKDAGDDLSRRLGDTLQCATGQFNVNMAMLCAQDRKDFSVFWEALGNAHREEYCGPKGIVNGKWFTLRSDPDGFSVCAGCFAAILEPLGLADSFTPKGKVPREEAVLCSFNPKSPRFVSYLQALLQSFFTRDTSSLEDIATNLANVPACRRDQDFKGGTWYGWEQCHICPGCYHEFVRGSVLDSAMSYRGVALGDRACMCEMYSPRMRSLYLEACAKSPPDASELLAFSDQRRVVYVNTVLRIRRMLDESRLLMMQQQTLNTMSSFYTNMGQMKEILSPSAYSYGAPGVGYGFQNQSAFQGAVYHQQALGVMQQGTDPNRVMAVRELEMQWRAVE